MAGCNSCSTTSGTKGCQNNGTCGTSDCNKMNSFDWLSHMGIPVVDKFDIVEVKFKGGRKDYFRNVDHLHLTTGDPVVVDVQNGYHIGYVSLQGELVRLQMQKRKIRDNDDILKIYRVANQRDLDKWENSRNREVPTLYRTKQIINELGLQMKLSDVEFQADNSKATFYYSADDRVDFRELIKRLAAEFKIRIEMRQISLRQEAGRLGGVGVCGRELCCSTWIHDFKSVSTSAARYQNLSLNPTKLSGQCGRLKCCLNYELDTYMDALKDIPAVDKPLLTESGPAKLQKTDIFRKLMWFSYNNDNNWHSIDCDRVREIQALNEKGEKPFNLINNKAFEGEKESSRSNKDLELLDKKFNAPVKRKKRRPKNQQATASETEKTRPKAGRDSSRKTHNRGRKGRVDQKGPESKKPNVNTRTDQAVNPQGDIDKKPAENKGHGKKKNRSKNRWKNSQNRNNPNEGKP